LISHDLYLVIQKKKTSFVYETFLARSPPRPERETRPVRAQRNARFGAARRQR
jgi:hypothetical protein